MTAAQQLDLLHDLTSICDEGDVDKISGVMNRHFHSLEGARSLFCVENPKYHRDFLPETRTFGNSGYLHGFMRNRRILNVKNFDERSDFSNTFTISCDTQFPSYLRRRVCGRPIPNIDDAITECLQYLYHYRSGLDIQPYLFENQNRIDSTEVAESIQAYITFIYSHQPTLQASGRIVSTLPSVDIDKMTSDAIQMYKGPDWRILASHAKQNWSTTYAMLIVAAIVDIKHKKKDRSYKLACLMERIDKITVIPKIELHLVNRFFEKGTEEHFFRKVQRQVKNITSQLGNMRGIYHISELFSVV